MNIRTGQKKQGFSWPCYNMTLPNCLNLNRENLHSLFSLLSVFNVLQEVEESTTGKLSMQHHWTIAPEPVVLKLNVHWIITERIIWFYEYTAAHSFCSQRHAARTLFNVWTNEVKNIPSKDSNTVRCFKPEKSKSLQNFTTCTSFRIFIRLIIVYEYQQFSKASYDNSNYSCWSTLYW